MENKFLNSVTRSRATLFLCLCLFLVSTKITTLVSAQEILAGFKANPSASVSSFQPLLNDSAAIFSLGFLRVNRTQLHLCVVHLPSLEPLWQANPTTSLFRWSPKTQLFFNGSLMLSDPHTRSFWSSAGTSESDHQAGDRLVLQNSSNLQISRSRDLLWQSFDFPTNTIVENQNFTSNMSLSSSNGPYSMRLGADFMGLYAEFKDGQQQIYWKHKALEAKAKVVEGQGPIHARVESDGFLGMYQMRKKIPVDIQPFNSYNRPINRFLFVRLEQDGNLKGYSWAQTEWVLDFQAILEACELPSPCGSYGLCRPGSGCSCLDSSTESDCKISNNENGDFCSSREGDFWVLRRTGVELPFKELMGSDTRSSSLDQCEKSCESNCSCWGAVYNNATGFCYFVDYPIQTLVGVGDESKVGYFKVREENKKKNVVLEVLGATILVVLVGVIGFGGYRIWKRRRGNKRILELEESSTEVSPGPYKDLGSASFKSIEMY